MLDCEMHGREVMVMKRLIMEYEHRLNIVCVWSQKHSKESSLCDGCCGGNRTARNMTLETTWESGLRRGLGWEGGVDIFGDGNATS